MGDLDRWVIVPIVVGLVFAGIQTFHIFQMTYYGTMGVLLESVVPWLLALVVVVTGPWLARNGYRFEERRRVVGWMAVFSVLVGLLFGWALSHQYIVGYPFIHARFVTTTNLIAGSLGGFVVGIYDVSSRRHRQAVEAERETVAQQRSRLSVLNRVLRHNLRNDLNAVSGYAELIETGSGDAGEYAARIREVSADLVSIGEKARQIEKVAATQHVHGTASLAKVVESTVEATRAASPACTVDYDLPASDMPVDESVIPAVLAELLDNACRHSDADEPIVEVTASVNPTDAYPLTIRVADNGPGIPEHELDPIREGRETALEHGSGLGLWLVEWGVSTVDGAITFEPNEPRGTVATISLPFAE